MFLILRVDTVLRTRGCFACILFLQMHTTGMNQVLLGARDPIMQLKVGGITYACISAGASAL